MIAKVMWYELATILVLALIVGADALRGNWNAAAAVIAFAIVAGAGPLVLLLLGDIVTRKQNAQLVQPRG